MMRTCSEECRVPGSLHQLHGFTQNRTGFNGCLLAGKNAAEILESMLCVHALFVQNDVSAACKLVHSRRLREQRDRLAQRSSPGKPCVVSLMEVICLAQKTHLCQAARMFST